MSKLLEQGAAFRLGRPGADREAIRKAVGQLYEVRSRFVHDGVMFRDGEQKTEHLLWDEREAWDLARRILDAEIRSLPEA